MKLTDVSNICNITTIDDSPRIIMRSGREYNMFITKILRLFFLLEKKSFIPVKNDRDFRPRKMINFEPKILLDAARYDF